MQFEREALGEKAESLLIGDVGVDPTGERKEASGAARAPIKVIDRQMRGGGHAVKAAGANRGGIGKKRDIGIKQKTACRVIPKGIKLCHIGDIPGGLLQAGGIQQNFQQIKPRGVIPVYLVKARPMASLFGIGRSAMRWRKRSVAQGDCA